MKFGWKIGSLSLLLLLSVLLLCLENLYRKQTSVVKLERQSRKDSELHEIVNEASSVNELRKIGKRKRKKILVYTSLFGALPWGYIPYSYNFTEYDGKLCPVYDCDVTYDKNQLNSSDLVVFYGRDLPSVEHMKSISRTIRPYDQYWLYFMHESPIFSYSDLPALNGIFNLTATYRSESDILITYWFYDPLQDGNSRPKPNTNFANGKNKLITWMNSHCDDDRISFVHKLRKLINVDVYGGCSKLFKPQTPPCPRNSKTCTDIQRQYKFFFAFENSFCIDYITEKYWLNGLDAGLVPVVFGYGDYKNEKLAIPGSYIDVNSFRTVKQLANYLLYLDKHDTAYNEYHQWRYKYKLVNHHCMCRFCEAIHSYSSSTIPSKTVDLQKFWGKHTCDENKTHLKALMQSD